MTIQIFIFDVFLHLLCRLSFYARALKYDLFRGVSKKYLFLCSKSARGILGWFHQYLKLTVLHSKAVWGNPLITNSHSILSKSQSSSAYLRGSHCREIHFKKSNLVSIGEKSSKRHPIALLFMRLRLII